MEELLDRLVVAVALATNTVVVNVVIVVVVAFVVVFVALDDLVRVRVLIFVILLWSLVLYY